MNTLVIILTVLTIVTAAFSLLVPSRLLSVYIITRPMIQPFIFLQYTFFVIPYSYIWAAILPLLYAVNFVTRGWTLLCHKSMPLVIILILSAFSLVVSIDIGASIDGLIKMLLGFLAFGTAYNATKSTKDVDQIVLAIALASVVPLAFGFYQELTGNFSQIHVSVTNRVNSVFGIGNAYGIFLTITMCAVMILLLQKNIKRNTRVLYVGLLAAMVVSQILALNRGTWLALTMGILVALVPYRRKVKIRWIVIGALLIAVTFSGVIIKRFTETHVRWDGSQANTFEGRQQYWISMIPDILDKPVLGYGIGTTGEVEGSPAPHNDYLRMTKDIGIFGGLVYTYFLVSLVFFFLRRKKIVGGIELWRYNFPMTVLNVYFVIISTTQNITQSFINFGFFLILNGAVIRLNMVRPKKKVPRNIVNTQRSNE